MHAGLVLPCFGDKTALNSVYKENTNLLIERFAVNERVGLSFWHKDLTLKYKSCSTMTWINHNSDWDSFTFSVCFVSAKQPPKF